MTRKNTVHTLYKKLLNFYPRAFREQLGESMEQTFNDLYKERRAEYALFGFVLWTFIETAMGIIQEHMLLIKETNPMKNIFTNLRVPAIIGFLIILPFIFLEITFVIIKRLTFDLRDTLDSTVIFGILWLGVAAILLVLMPLVRQIREGNKSMANPVPAPGHLCYKKRHEKAFYWMSHPHHSLPTRDPNACGSALPNSDASFYSDTCHHYTAIYFYP